MKNLSILGSTGSIGTNTLDLVQKNPQKFCVLGLSAGKNLTLLKEQILCFHPQVVSVAQRQAAEEMQTWLKKQNCPQPHVSYGEQGACEVASWDGVDLTMGAMVGAIGLKPTLKALQKGIDVGLANKESMVIAGCLMNEAAEKSGAKILPVDSEHNAIFQALQGHHRHEVRRILLTASGGPFRHKSKEELAHVTPKQALKHPNWDMGAKITIDSATMMNKGLEVIEAHFLFHFPPSKIDIVVHPQSIVHSMVEYCDGSVLAQMGIPDMRIPIGYAMAYPQRLANDLPALDLISSQKLEFYPPDPDRFPCLKLAYEALRIGKTMPTVLNAANEIAVAHFLSEKIKFLDIPMLLEKVMYAHDQSGLATAEDLETLIECDQWARQACLRLMSH